MNVKHYFKNGKQHKGSYHKMANGKLHTGAKHSSSSKQIFHYGDLSKKAKNNAKKSWKK